MVYPSATFGPELFITPVQFLNIHNHLKIGQFVWFLSGQNFFN
jgi:hypothetical protein